MPSLYTHYLFGQKILKKINSSLKEDITGKIKYYNMYNQGFDNLYYYHKNWSYYKKLGIQAHKNNIANFFTNMINLIKENNIKDNEIRNMLYGFINHYVIDTITHPFINYQAKKYNIPHTKIEYIIDNYLYNENNKEKWHKEIYRELIPKLTFSNDLIQFIDTLFYQTYNEKKIGHVFNASHHNSYYLYRYLINDPHGLKSKGYFLIDILLRKNNDRLSDCTYYFKDDDNDILNLKHTNWHEPHDNTEIYNYSFLDLFYNCLKIATNINNLAYNVLNGKEDLTILIAKINKLSLKNMQELLWQ